MVGAAAFLQAAGRLDESAQAASSPGESDAVPRFREGHDFLVLFVLPLLVTRHPVGDLDIPRHRWVPVTVVQMQPGGIAREFTDRPLGPR